MDTLLINTRPQTLYNIKDFPMLQNSRICSKHQNVALSTSNAVARHKALEKCKELEYLPIEVCFDLEFQNFSTTPLPLPPPPVQRL
jgi:hypothetical protein